MARAALKRTRASTPDNSERQTDRQTDRGGGREGDGESTEEGRERARVCECVKEQTTTESHAWIGAFKYAHTLFLFSLFFSPFWCEPVPRKQTHPPIHPIHLHPQGLTCTCLVVRRRFGQGVSIPSIRDNASSLTAGSTPFVFRGGGVRGTGRKTRQRQRHREGRSDCEVSVHTHSAFTCVTITITTISP